ncbi:TIGR02328 family protein [Enterococcus hirae]|uniref:TIGR02328 family protein n=1 Tax=Enterococcus hirae TaxID=1354 RepID=UPI00054D6C1E|nr:TIGR02328 family protein [Enterococcus hirae]OWW65689.1 hypothetical protein C655_11050 [Enterococcus hirae 57-09-G6]EMF0043396.1 hypothetical protein [Enterococcus hirae]EMF0055272.1 hypothetical protein [Enterococcus hirae]EMF0057530.1 hypothetical protein [Enterococcus hirae]EMF0073581.1 hypothetical protein [Enterococcus hirae]
MRLWHEELIPLLPRKQLLGQHRECCALRGNGWGRKHATVDYVFQHSPYKLYQYHQLILTEMKNRHYLPSPEWSVPEYHGKACDPYTNLSPQKQTSPIYPEHDEDYLMICLTNLKQKGIDLIHIKAMDS